MKSQHPVPAGRPQRRKSSLLRTTFGIVLSGTIAAVACFGCWEARALWPGKRAERPVPALLVPLPPGGADLVNPKMAVTVERFRRDRVPMVLIEGGIPGSRRAPVRCGVEAFVKSSGAAAGLNGTFFANASLRGTDNLLIGPSLCGNESQATLSPYDQKPQLQGRPLVLLSAGRTRILPYDSATMDSEASLRYWMPGLTDAFLGGAWLVHNGIAADADTLDRFHVTDANDPRRRAFFGLTTDGRPVLGATTYVTSSLHLARALRDSGLREAVLLDSGFSTSLVYGDRILVTGHTAPGLPSRPVPHAIVLFNTKATTALEPVTERRARHRRHRTI